MKNVCLNGETLNKLIELLRQSRINLLLDIDIIKVLKVIGFQLLNGVLKKVLFSLN